MEIISKRQCTLMAVAFTLDATLISLPSQLVGVSHQNAWLTYAAAMLVILFSLWLLTRVGKRFPEQDLFEALVTRYRAAGRVVVLLLTAFYFFILLRDLRMVVDFTNVALLPLTPVFIIGLLAVSAIIPIVNAGVEVQARMSELFQTLLIVAVLSIPLLVAREFDLTSIQPILVDGLEGILQGGWLGMPYLGELLILPFLFSQRTAPFRTIAFGLGIGTFLLTLLIFLNLVVLGVHISSRFMYPNHELIRQIRLTDFLDRFDLAIVTIWLSAMLVKISYSVFVVCRGLKRCLPSLDEKRLAPSVTLLALVCGFWFFENALQLLNLNHSLPVLAVFYYIALPVLLFAFLRPRKEAEEDEEERKEATAG